MLLFQPIPAQPLQPTQSYFTSTGDAIHIAVVHRGRWFVLEVLDREGRVPLSVEALRERIVDILQLASDRNPASTSHAIGTFTGAPRDLWARAREQMLTLDREAGSPTNASSLLLIETSLFVVCLDEGDAPAGRDACQREVHAQYQPSLCRGSIPGPFILMNLAPLNPIPSHPAQAIPSHSNPSHPMPPIISPLITPQYPLYFHPIQPLLTNPVILIPTPSPSLTSPPFPLPPSLSSFPPSRHSPPLPGPPPYPSQPFPYRSSLHVAVGTDGTISQ